MRFYTFGKVTGKYQFFFFKFSKFFFENSSTVRSMGTLNYINYKTAPRPRFNFQPHWGAM